MPKTSLIIFSLLILFFSLVYAHSHSHGSGGCPHGHSHDTAKAAANQAAGLDEFGNQWVEAKAPERERTLEEKISLWWTAMGSTVLISLAPFIILFFVPLDQGEEFKPLLNILLAFAAGGLLGDSFLHLIPHAIPEEDNQHAHTHSHGGEGHGHSHNEGHVTCNLWVLGGILTFLFIEKFARMMNLGHSHSHGHGEENNAISETTEQESVTSDEPSKDKNDVDSKESAGEKPNDEKSEIAKNEAWLPEMDVSGYLNLAADFSHNFTDGLAIGASYLAGNTVGLITTFTILIHEVPHEIGDFAIN